MNNFFTGFEKQAEKDKQDGKGMTALKATGINMAGSSVVPLAAAGLAGAMSPSAKPHELRRLVKDVKSRDKNMTARVSFKMPYDRKTTFGLTTSHYAPGLNYIHSKPSLGILGHEMGHASGSFKTNPRPYTVSKGFHALGALAAPIVASSTDNKTVQNAATVAPAVMAAPMLYEEGKASIKGLNNIRKTFGTGRMLREAPSLAAAFASYAATPAVAALASRWAIKHRNKGQSETK